MNCRFCGDKSGSWSARHRIVLCLNCGERLRDKVLIIKVYAVDEEEEEEEELIAVAKVMDEGIRFSQWRHPKKVADWTAPRNIAESMWMTSVRTMEGAFMFEELLDGGI